MTKTGCTTLLGLTWADGSPAVRVRHDDELVSSVVPLAGLRLNYRARPDATRRCLGHVPFRKGQPGYVDCLNRPEPGSAKCARCSVVDATFAGSLHHAHTRDAAELDPDVAERLRQPNLLYLAAFRDGSVKVGTSSVSRRLERLTEQGAWLARFVAEADDGVVVRQLEDRVTHELGLPQSVSTSRKLAGMLKPVDDRRLDEALADAEAAVHAVIEAMDDERLQGVSRPWSAPGIDAPVWAHVHPYPLDLTTGQHDLELVDACGRVVAVTRPGPDGAGADDIFLVDLRSVFGLELEIGDFESDELAVQDSLF